MVRHGLVLVVMPVRCRPREIRKVVLVPGAVGTVMFDRQVQSHAQCKGARRQPSQQHGNGNQTLQPGTHNEAL